MQVFGPVPSRRLGRSIGINHVPAKTCSYSCIYCQVGRTRDLRVERRAFSTAADVADKVRERLAQLRLRREIADYVTFVPDGEPTLDANLGREIKAAHSTGARVAVISNGSLLHRRDVRADLSGATWVSLKIDTVDERTWRRLNRPHPELELAAILDGMLAFREEFGGTLVTETMLVAGVNDTAGEAETTAAFLYQLAPHRAYVSVPLRPPTLDWVHPPDGSSLNRCFQIFDRELPSVELLIGYEGNSFSGVAGPAESLLEITAVHPMRKDAVCQHLRRVGADWSKVEELLESGQLQLVEYEGRQYLLRRPL